MSSVLPNTRMEEKEASPVERYSNMTPRRSHSEPLQVETFVKDFETDWSILIEPTLKHHNQDSDVMSDVASEKTVSHCGDDCIEASKPSTRR